jgi:hypothetical protein
MAEFKGILELQIEDEKSPSASAPKKTAVRSVHVLDCRKCSASSLQDLADHLAVSATLCMR